MNLKYKKLLFTSFLFVFSGIILFNQVTKTDVSAATLTSAYTYLSRIKAGEVTGVDMVYVLTPSANTDGSDTITVRFPDSEDGQWCYTGGGSSLTISTDMTGYIDVLESVISLPGTLTATCTAGSGAGSFDEITITGVNALTSGTTYGFKVIGNAAVLGTATATGDHTITMDLNNGGVIQTFSFGVELISDDQVVVSAEVSDVSTVNCSISSNTLNLGTLFKGGSYVSGSHTFTVSTDASSNGYYVAAWGTGDGTNNAGLYKSTATTHLIASDFASNTVNLGTGEGYGLRVSDPDAGGSAAVYADFANGTSSVFGTLGFTTGNAKILFYQNSAETSGDTSTITHGASAGASAVAGSYEETVTFMCGGFY